MTSVDLKGTNYDAASQLEQWSRDWDLGKNWLLCRLCGGIQTFEGAAGGKAFAAHKDKCLIGNGGDRYPLHELRTVLDALSPPVHLAGYDIP